MQRTLTLIYVITAAGFALYSTILEVQPAWFLIDFMAPNAGDEYSVTLVWLLITFLFLSPLFIFLLITRVIRSKPQEIIDPDRTGIFVTRQKAFQSAIVGFPVYVNAKKVGLVDNGKTKFFDIPFGNFSLQVGNGKQASKELELYVAMRQQLNYHFYLTQAGLNVKVVLEEM